MYSKISRPRPHSGQWGRLQSEWARRVRARAVDLAIAGSLFATTAIGAFADPHPVIPSGLPVQVVPTFKEPGAPAFSFPAGGVGNISGGDGGGTGVGGNGGVDNGGSVYDTMMSRAWGSQAEDAASTMGINASALAGTCMMESGCQNIGAGNGSSASGVFQMINSTYLADIKGAMAFDPSIADSIVSGLDGKMDPATQAYAAAYELRSAALQLQKNGISDPTVLDTRAVYQFGSGDGVDVARADASANLASLLSLTDAQLKANGITSSTTVGDWRQTVTNKLGSTASQVVLSRS